MHTCSAEFTEPSPTVSYARVSAKSCAHALLRSTRCCSSLSSPAAASASRRSSRLDTSERSAPPGCDCSARPSRCASSATTLQGVMARGRRLQCVSSTFVLNNLGAHGLACSGTAACGCQLKTAPRGEFKFKRPRTCQFCPALLSHSRLPPLRPLNTSCTSTWEGLVSWLAGMLQGSVWEGRGGAGRGVRVPGTADQKELHCHSEAAAGVRAVTGVSRHTLARAPATQVPCSHVHALPAVRVVMAARQLDVQPARRVGACNPRAHGSEMGSLALATASSRAQSGSSHSQSHCMIDD